MDTILHSIARYIVSLHIASWIYAIVCTQVVAGFPPFYVHGKSKHQSKDYLDRHLNYSLRNLYLMFLSVGFIIASTAFENNLLAFGCLTAAPFFAVLYGLRERRFLKSQPNLPLPLIDMVRFRLPFVGVVTNRYPMLAFDLWTVGTALGMYLIVVFTMG